MLNASEDVIREVLALEEMQQKLIVREKAQKDFMVFVKYVYENFIEGTHHKKISTLFEKLSETPGSRIIVNMPPRHTKSEFASYLLPAWLIGKNPKLKIIQTTHTAELAVRFGRKVRNLMELQIYKDIFPDVDLRIDSKAAGRWETGQGGEYYAAGVGGAITGRGADLLIIDDPHSEQDALSETAMEGAYEWYTSGPRQRLQPGGSIVIVMTRWSLKDLTGKLLKAQGSDVMSDQWDVVEFPAILPSDKVLWPEFWKKDELLSTFIFDNFRIFTIPNHWITSVILFFAVDFIWYWYHRFGHTLNILWGAHITHHQSEEYNYTLSFRVSILQLMIRTFFWMWLPFLGFDPFEATLFIGINAGYQYFIHTKLIDKLGFLEKILVTPSHHRVHHGKNEQYIDKNYSGMFIIWDKLFGTFEPEVENVEYGITKPLESNNPINAWFHYYRDLYHAMKLEKGLWNKVKLLFAGPESMSQFYEGKPVVRKKKVFTNNIKTYLSVQFGLICALGVAMYYFYNDLNTFYLWSLTAILIISVLSIGYILDLQKFGLTIEIVRLFFISFVLGASAWHAENNLYLLLSGLYLAVFLPWFWYNRDFHLRSEEPH